MLLHTVLRDSEAPLDPSDDKLAAKVDSSDSLSPKSMPVCLGLRAACGGPRSQQLCRPVPLTKPAHHIIDMLNYHLRIARSETVPGLAASIIMYAKRLPKQLTLERH